MALTGFLQLNTCYSTAADATNAYFSAMPPLITASGTSTVRTEYVQVTGVWNLKKTTTTNAGVSTSLQWPVTPLPTFPACDPMLGFTDGLAMAAIIVGLIFTAVTGGIVSKAVK